MAIITPQQLGAAGDGIRDDSDELIAALTSYRPVELIGQFRVTKPFWAVGCPGIWGRGAGESQIIFDAPNLCLPIYLTWCANPWGRSPQVVLRDFAIVPRAVSAYPAVYLKGPPSSGSSQPTFHIQNVHVLPENPALEQYNFAGIHLDDMRNGTISDCTFAGRQVYPHPAAGGAIMFFSSAYPPTRSNPVDLHVRDCQSSWFRFGVWLQGAGSSDPAQPSDWQGVFIRSTTVLAAENGIHAITSDKFSALLHVHGCNFNVFKRAIYAPNIWHPSFKDNDVMFIGNEPSVVAIDMPSNGQNWPIKGCVKDNNIVFSRPTPIQNAIGINCGAVGGGGAFTVVGDNTMHRGNCASLAPLASCGGTIYESGTRVLA